MRKKQIKINQRQIGEIVSEINEIAEACKDQALLEQLRLLAEQAENLPVTDSKDLVGIDDEILSCAKELHAAIREGNVHTGQFLMGKITDLFTEHTRACPSGSHEYLAKSERKIQKQRDKQARKAHKRRARLMDKGSIEELRREISGLNDENKKAQERCDILKKQRKNAATKSEFEQVESQLKIEEYQIASNEESIRDLLRAIEHKSAEETLKKQKKTVKKVGKAAPYNDEELVTQAKELERERERAAQSQSVVDSIMNGTINGRNAREETGASPVAAAGETWVNPYANEKDPSRSSTNSKMEDYFEDVDEQAGVLEGTIKEVERELREKSSKLRSLSEEITALLKERRNATAAECIILDGTIDSKYSAYSTVKLGIDRLNQERANMSMELGIVEQIKDIRNASRRNERIAELSGGRFLNIGELATAVNNDVKRKNERTADVRDAVAVANATPIDSKTFAETGVTYDTAVKDEEKYAGMEREFGLRA